MGVNSGCARPLQSQGLACSFSHVNKWPASDRVIHHTDSTPALPLPRPSSAAASPLHDAPKTPPSYPSKTNEFMVTKPAQDVTLFSPGIFQSGNKAALPSPSDSSRRIYVSFYILYMFSSLAWREAISLIAELPRSARSEFCPRASQ